MSVSLEEAINGAGYNLSDVDDCKWLLGKKEEFEELCEKAEELVNLYDEYEWDVKELEDSDEYGRIVSFEEWRKINDR